MAVLEWVRDNIARFGGDPNKVTIFGQSGGGGKVGALMAMPAAKGLFHRAIVQSGSMLHAGTPEDTGRLAAAYLAELGLSKSELDKLHTIPTERLTTATFAAMRKSAPPHGAAPTRGRWSAAWVGGQPSTATSSRRTRSTHRPPRSPPTCRC